MSAVVGRFVLICLALAMVLFVGWRLALGNAGLQESLFNRGRESQMLAIAPVTLDPGKLLAQTCAAGGCLLVRAEGRVFLVDAAAGAARGMARLGGLSEHLDGVLLTELEPERLEGLIGVRTRSIEAGRRQKLPIYGPTGAEQVADGLNAMLEVSDADRSVRFPEGMWPFSAVPVEAADMAGADTGQPIFDSGVLQIYAFPVMTGNSGAESLVYRFDREDESLIVGGCQARLEDIQRASKDLTHPFDLVLPAASGDQLMVLRDLAREAGLKHQSRFIASAADTCLSPTALRVLAGQSGARNTLASPLFPHPGNSVEERIWRRELAGEPTVEPGVLGAGVN